jgi:hypothetical protein
LAPLFPAATHFDWQCDDAGDGVAFEAGLAAPSNDRKIAATAAVRAKDIRCVMIDSLSGNADQQIRIRIKIRWSADAGKLKKPYMR